MNINIEDFAKVEIKVGTVLEAIKVPEADKLLKIVFDFGPADQAPEGFTILPELSEKYPGKYVRQIMSAIAQAFPDPQVLVGKQICVITNLEPRKFRGYESQGMLMATGSPEEGIVFIGPESRVSAGSQVK